MRIHELGGKNQTRTLDRHITQLKTMLQTYFVPIDKH